MPTTESFLHIIESPDAVNELLRKKSIAITDGPGEELAEDAEVFFALEGIGEIRVILTSVLREKGLPKSNPSRTIIFSICGGRHDNFYHAKYDVKTRRGVIFHAFNKYPDL
ncbi:hypothetical protein HYV44_00390 [Candidatus Microgenomates bacterium]|nr:hypothetical protein [Candidatus Microgenomates bacterium]